MTGKLNMAAIVVVMLISSIVFACTLPNVRAASASTTFSETIVTSNEYRTVPGTTTNLTEYYERYVGVSATNWTCNITFPGWTWDTTGGAFANASSVIIVNIMLSNVHLNSTHRPDVGGVVPQQTAIWLQLTPYKTAQVSYAEWNNGTGTLGSMGDAFTWDNSSIMIYAVDDDLTICRNASTSGAHNDTFTLTSGVSSVNTVQPKYLYYWLYTGSGGYQFNDTISAGEICFTFDELEATQIINILISDVIPVMVTLAVVSVLLGAVTTKKLLS